MGSREYEGRFCVGLSGVVGSAAIPTRTCPGRCTTSSPTRWTSWFSNDGHRNYVTRAGEIGCCREHRVGGRFSQFARVRHKSCAQYHVAPVTPGASRRIPNCRLQSGCGEHPMSPNAGPERCAPAARQAGSALRRVPDGRVPGAIPAST